MNKTILFVGIPFLLIIATIVIEDIISQKRKARENAEQELQMTRKSLKDLCEACINENNSTHARITYVAYFGKPVNHTGDGFIDGYE